MTNNHVASVVAGADRVGTVRQAKSVRQCYNGRQTSAVGKPFADVGQPRADKFLFLFLFFFSNKCFYCELRLLSSVFFILT